MPAFFDVFFLQLLDLMCEKWLRIPSVFLWSKMHLNKKKSLYLCFLWQVLLLDGRGHLLGRLAAIVAKQVLLGTI